MNSLLVCPPFPDTFWSFRHALSFTRRRATLPPLGLLTMAALLPAGWEKRLVDLNIASLGDEDLAWADLVFIGAMVVQHEGVVELIDRCHALGRTVVAGGPLFTVEPERFPQVDHLVLGEAERSLQPFLDDLANGRARKVYHAEGFADLALSPIPLWELADLQGYMTASIQATRGCPFSCDFCNVTQLLGRRHRHKTASQIIRELDELWNRGWRKSVFFVDDNFIGNRGWLKRELLPALLEWRQTGENGRARRGMPFHTQVSIDLADHRDVYEMMARAGFDAVFIGLESPEEESLAECGKVQNRGRDLAADTRCLQQAGLQVQGGFIVGFDSDTQGVFKRQLEFIQSTGIVTAMVGMLQAPPGTRLYQRLLAAGRITFQEWGDNADGLTNIIPGMGLDNLTEKYRTLMATLYAPRQYYGRVRRLLRELKIQPARIPMDADRLLSLLRSMWRLGILGRERFQYWGLLRWTLMHRPRAFPLAITLAIYGHHFRRVCELHLGR